MSKNEIPMINRIGITPVLWKSPNEGGHSTKPLVGNNKFAISRLHKCSSIRRAIRISILWFKKINIMMTFDLISLNGFIPQHRRTDQRTSTRFLDLYQWIETLDISEEDHQDLLRDQKSLPIDKLYIDNWFVI